MIILGVILVIVFICVVVGRCWHHVGMRELLDLHCTLIMDLSTQCFIYELLSGIHHAQVSLSFCKLSIKIELHQLLETLIPIFRKRVSQKALYSSDTFVYLCVCCSIVCRARCHCCCSIWQKLASMRCSCPIELFLSLLLQVGINRVLLGC